MTDIISLNPTGIPKIDDIIHGTIGLCELMLPGRIRGYYLARSHARQKAVCSSDIDLIILLKAGIDHDDLRKLQDLRQYCWLMSSEFDLHLDFVIESSHLRFGEPAIKLASRCIYGEDIRDQIPQQPIEFWTHASMNNLIWFQTTILRRGLECLRFPLDYPSPGEEFYGYDRGYDRSKMRSWDDSSRGCTQELVRTIGLSAALIVAISAQRCVPTKTDVVSEYKEYVNDEWAVFVEESFECCRNRWQYFVPASERERGLLRDICERALIFENHTLGVCRDYLLGELHRKEDISVWVSVSEAVQLWGLSKSLLDTEVANGRIESQVRQGDHLILIEKGYTLSAINLLRRIIYPDVEILNSVKALDQGASSYIRAAVNETLRKIQEALGGVDGPASQVQLPVS